MSSADNIVEVRKAYKSYDTKRPVLRGLDMTVERGSIYAFLGPSGCGKTTLLKSIVGRNTLDGGTIFVGIKGRSQIGYMPQDIALVEEITIRETMCYYGWMYNLRGQELEERKKDLFSLLDIPPETRKVKNLSGGQQRRISLCLSLLHIPELMILDEPTVGTDPLLSQRIWQCFVEMSAVRKKTIIVTTHYIEEARQSNRVGMMREGVLLKEGEAESLITQYGVDTLEDVFIRLCYKQDNEDAKEVPQVTNKTVKNTNVPPPLANGKLFSSNNLISYLLKSLFYLKYSPFGWFLLFFFPISVCLAFEYSMGREPTGLRVAIINDELEQRNTVCAQFENETCFPASCLYVSILEKKLVIVPYSSVNTALRDASKNSIWGVMHFSENYTESFFQRIMENRRAGEDVLEQSEVAVRMDMSNQLIGSLIKRDIIFSYFEYLDKLYADCKWPVRYAKMPITVKGAVFGTMDINIGEFTVAGLLLLLEYFLPITYVLAFVHEKKEGILERSLIAGMTIPELLLGHSIVTMTMFILQTLCAMLIIYTIYGHVYVGSIGLGLALIFLVGFSGLSFGLTVALLFDNETAASFFILGSFVPTSILSGMFWPTEGMHYLLRSISFLLPLTRATEAFRSITSRAWTLAHPVVYTGFLSLIIYILLLSFVTFMLIRRNNGIGSQ